MPVRATVNLMPRVKCPDASRTNAMRSRCFGSMFAWILNTNPDTGFSSGNTARSRAGCERGGGASFATPVRSSRTPKLLTAEPKNTGVR